MSDRRKFDAVKKQIDSVGKGFCAAKWYNSTIWLSNGRTASCHHPAAHSIPARALIANHKVLHNTPHKKEMRKQMLNGHRPDECSYCWQVEDADSTVHSDRTYKSAIYTPEEIDALKTMDWDADVDPKTLEISFDNLCNLSCSYCNAEFSSTWSNDIKTNGWYQGMQTSGGQAYQNDGSHAMAFDAKADNNFYVKSFFKWFDDSLKNNLQELRVTGGEPTRSPDFWKLVDRCEGAKFRFAVNSNLMTDADKLEALIACSKKFQHFDLYTSCETHGKMAELVRHGLEYNTWLSNLNHFAQHGNYKTIYIMMTVSAISLFGMTEFIDDMIDLKRKYNSKELFSMSFNILRFPSFQSVNILPMSIKKKIADDFEAWHDTRKGFLSERENNQFKRLISYLRNVDKSYEDIDTHDNKINDFAKFFNQYTARRQIEITEVINDEDFAAWWKEINEKPTN
jgi:organic radical activating enzyme